MGKILVLPSLAMLMIMFGLIASGFGVGNQVFKSDSCLTDPNTCSIVVDQGDGFWGIIQGFFATIFNFFAVFFQILTFQTDLNATVNLILVGFILMTCISTVYVLLRQG